MKFIQSGYNGKYPRVIETWTWGEDVPEWLSDIAKVGAIDGTTNKVFLECRDLNNGGYELLDSSGQSSLVKAASRKDYICRELNRKGGKLFALTPSQLKLMYMSYGER
jgi:hypothetical protein